MTSNVVPQFYVRYVDDILAVFSNPDSINPFLNYINNLHNNIKFTVEYAKNTFPFLNVELRINETSFDSWVYRKPTHTGLMLNYTAMAPDSWKRGFICCLLNIAQKLSKPVFLQ